MRKTVLGSFVALVCALASAASSTPPDMIDIRDELFGVAPCCVLVKPTTNDNLGLYGSIHSDVVLVSIDREGGSETLYPVYRVRSQPDLDRDANGNVMAHRAEPLPGSVEPFTLLAELNGIPVQAGDYLVSGPEPTMRIGEMLAVPVDRNSTLQVEIAQLMRQVAASVASLALVVGEYDRLAPITTAELLEGRFSGPFDCRFDSAWRLDDRSGTAPTTMLRADCDNDGEFTSILVWIPERH